MSEMYRGYRINKIDEDTYEVTFKSREKTFTYTSLEDAKTDIDIWLDS